MNFDDEEEIPVLLDTSASRDNLKASGPDVAKPDDFQVPLTIVTGNLKRPKPASYHLIKSQAILGPEKPHWSITFYVNNMARKLRSY